MIVRALGTLLTIAVAGMFGQRGLFGPITVRVKAGDVAPDVGFTKILNSPAEATWNPAILSGQMTVLAPFPDTSHNLQSVTRWNGLVAQFAGKPVQFVWITAEDESTLVPWLAEHPVQGWLLLDRGGSTGRAYGMETPAAVIIGADRKIIGFDQMMVPSEDTINAALEGRITTARPSPADLRSFMQSRKVLLAAEPMRMPRPDDHKPAFPPSYTLHITPSQNDDDRGNFGGGDFLSLKGFDLQDVIRDVWSLNPIRAHLPAALDNGKRYDFAMVLPEPEDRQKTEERFRHGIQDYFHVNAISEERLVDVYVVSAPGRKPPAAKTDVEDDDFGFATSGSVGFSVAGFAGEIPDFTKVPKAVNLSAIRSIEVDGTAADFCRTLEQSLDRPVVDETNLQGAYAVHVQSARRAKNDFLDRLREQTGLVITPAQRTVSILVFTPR